MPSLSSDFTEVTVSVGKSKNPHCIHLNKTSGLSFRSSGRNFKPKEYTERTAVPLHAMKPYRESGGTVPLIPKLDARWRKVVNFKCQPLYPQGKYTGAH